MSGLQSLYSQYHSDLFTKLDFPFQKRKKILDIGCGEGIDSTIFAEYYKLNTHASDLSRHKNFNKLKQVKFKTGSVFKLPYNTASFDYAFLHDVMHHVDEQHQAKKRHEAALNEAFRVVKKGGSLIIVEGNRYNPLFYPHMVLMLGHNHFTQSYFKRLILSLFPQAKFKFFEAHVYPPTFIRVFKLYEWLMEHLVPEYFRAYNVAIIRK